MKKRLLFFRIGAIGDVIQVLPTLKYAKEKDPDASVELITGCVMLEDLINRSCAFVDKVHIVKKEPKDSKSLMASLLDNPVEEFTYLHTNPIKGRLWNKFDIKAKKFNQFKKDISVSAQVNFTKAFDSGFSGELSNNTIWAEESIVIKSSKPYICIVLGVGQQRPHRAYPLEQWLSLIDLVLKKTDLRVKILGGPEEAELSKDFDKAFHEESLLSIASQQSDDEHYTQHVDNLIGKTNFLELSQIIKNAKHIFSADTGLLHLADALDVPITSVFSITNEKRTGPLSKTARVLRSETCECNPDMSNSQKKCSNLKNGYASCMWGIKPEELLTSLC